MSNRCELKRSILQQNIVKTEEVARDILSDAIDSAAQVYVEMDGEKPKKGEAAKAHEFEINNSTISHTFAHKSDIPKFVNNC